MRIAIANVENRGCGTPFKADIDIVVGGGCHYVDMY